MFSDNDIICCCVVIIAFALIVAICFFINIFNHRKTDDSYGGDLIAIAITIIIAVILCFGVAGLGKSAYMTMDLEGNFNHYQALCKTEQNKALKTGKAVNRQREQILGNGTKDQLEMLGSIPHLDLAVGDIDDNGTNETFFSPPTYIHYDISICDQMDPTPENVKDIKHKYQYNKKAADRNSAYLKALARIKAKN